MTKRHGIRCTAKAEQRHKAVRELRAFNKAVENDRQEAMTKAGLLDKILHTAKNVTILRNELRGIDPELDRLLPS